MKCFVISLKRTPRRLQAFYEMNGNSNRIEHFEAIDGREVDRPALVAQSVIEADRLTAAK